MTVRSTGVAYWAAKDREHEWEDGAAYSARRGLYAVADGAAQGYRSGDWAQNLTRAYVDRFEEYLDAGVNDPKEVARSWFAGTVGAWQQEAQLAVTDNWWEQPAPKQQPAAATFLGVRLSNQGAKCRWQAWAIGDCCFFHVRAEEVHTSFPMTSKSDFNLRPSLVYTEVQRLSSSMSKLQYGEGTFEDGDWFFLTTDALAESLLRQSSGVRWIGLAHLGQDAFRRLIAELRANEHIKFDDATLLAVSVGDSGDTNTARRSARKKQSQRISPRGDARTVRRRKGQ